MELLTQFVASIGFPIVAWYMMFQQMQKMQDDHKEESKGFITAINNNTEILNILREKLEDYEQRP